MASEVVLLGRNFSHPRNVPFSLSENNWHLRSNIFSDLFLFLLKVYWCSPPENMTFDNLTDWFVMSGQLDSLERCHVYDVDYHKVEK